MIIQKTDNSMSRLSVAEIQDEGGKPVRVVQTHDDVERFLKSKPDQSFLLVDHIKGGTVIPPEHRSCCGVEHGDILCGKVRYDSKRGEVVCGG